MDSLEKLRVDAEYHREISGFSMDVKAETMIALLSIIHKLTGALNGLMPYTTNLKAIAIIGGVIAQTRVIAERIGD